LGYGEDLQRRRPPEARDAQTARDLFSVALSPRRPVKAELTAREREMAAHLLNSLTSKETRRALATRRRTVETHRTHFMRG
jgi:FixJ family two-component response regulator